jgi:hypothetical protein
MQHGARRIGPQGCHIAGVTRKNTARMRVSMQHPHVAGAVEGARAGMSV